MRGRAGVGMGWAAVVALSAMSFGCGATTGLEEGDAGALRCNPGEVSTCACPGGGSGTQTCGADRVFAPCACGDAGSGGHDGSLIEEDASGGADTAPPIGGGPGSGEIRCGVMSPTMCSIGGGEKCCILEPGVDHCIGPGESCDCTGPSCRVTIATCDGPEDCPSGEVCCGTFSAAAGAYTSIERARALPSRGQGLRASRRALHPEPKFAGRLLPM